MELDQALMLAKRSVFRKVRDYRRDAYSATDGAFHIFIESTPHDQVISGGFGFEHNQEYRITVLKNDVVICRHTFSEKDMAGFGDTLHHEVDGDVRIKELFEQMSMHRVTL